MGCGAKCDGVQEQGLEMHSGGGVGGNWEDVAFIEGDDVPAFVVEVESGGAEGREDCEKTEDLSFPSVWRHMGND